MRWLLALLAMAGSAQAGEHEATFATAFGVGVDKVAGVTRFELPAGNQATHVMIGRFGTATGALVMTCADTCTWQRADFGTAESIALAGIVDLNGVPMAIPTRGLSGTKVPGRRAMKFPAAVVVTREAAGKRRKLYLLSLLEADRGSLVLMETIEERASGNRGYRRTFQLDKGETKGTLELIVKEQRTGCEDGELIYVLEEHHFRTRKVTLGKC